MIGSEIDGALAQELSVCSTLSRASTTDTASPKADLGGRSSTKEPD
jgi:hypothetical protein